MRASWVGYGRTVYDGIEKVSVFFSALSPADGGETVKFIYDGVTGSLPSTATYIDPAYDDSGWPDVQLPVMTDDEGTAADVPPGTTFAAGLTPGFTHWVARATIDFPDYAIPANVTGDSFHFAGPDPGEKLYALLLATDDNAWVYIDGVEVVSNNTDFRGGEYTNSYLCSVAPGPHVVVIDQLGDDNFDYMGLNFAQPAVLNVVDGRTPGQLTGGFDIGISRAPGYEPTLVSTDSFLGAAIDVRLDPSGLAREEQFINFLLDTHDYSIPAGSSALVLQGPRDYVLSVHDGVWEWTESFTVEVPVVFPNPVSVRPQVQLRAQLHEPAAFSVPGVGVESYPRVRPIGPNDNYADARLLTGASGEVTFDITGSTVEEGELDLAGAGHTVWFVWTAPSTGVVNFDTADTPAPRWDSFLALFSDGVGIPSFSRLLDTDDDSFLQPGVTTVDGFGTSRISFSVIARQTYYLQVSSYDYPAGLDGMGGPGTNPSAGYPRSDAKLRWSVT